jgi:ABC-type multidrug transport system permease subunit
MFVIAMPLMSEIPIQRSLVKRERSSGSYRGFLVFLARWMSTMPFLVIASIFLPIPIYFLVGYHTTAVKFLNFLLVMIVHGMSANSFGFFVGSSVKDVRTALVVGPLIMTVFMIFSGVSVNLDALNDAFRW